MTPSWLRNELRICYNKYSNDLHYIDTRLINVAYMKIANICVHSIKDYLRMSKWCFSFFLFSFFFFFFFAGYIFIRFILSCRQICPLLMYPSTFLLRTKIPAQVSGTLVKTTIFLVRQLMVLCEPPRTFLLAPMQHLSIFIAAYDTHWDMADLLFSSLRCSVDSKFVGWLVVF